VGTEAAVTFEPADEAVDLPVAWAGSFPAAEAFSSLAGAFGGAAGGVAASVGLPAGRAGAFTSEDRAGRSSAGTDLAGAEAVERLVEPLGEPWGAEAAREATPAVLPTAFGAGGVFALVAGAATLPAGFFAVMRFLERGGDGRPSDHHGCGGSNTG
jgi:hypothetical protein